MVSGKAIIFDMDGILLDSEPLWQQVEYDIFSRLGVALTLADCQQTTGLRCDYVVDFWYTRQPWPHPNHTPEQAKAHVVAQIIEQMSLRIVDEVPLLPFVARSLTALKAAGWRIGLATSSHERIMHSVLNGFAIAHLFDAVQSAEHLPFAKPHPEVYLKAAAKLNIPPEHCIAIEDSVTGMIAAKAARMKVIAIPYHEQQADPRFTLADITLPNMAPLLEHICQQ